ncbi:hypothetical protein FPV67DRAFT_1452554 [Lyophyllum atratum]|nr:hypothetical protein FPV67DRAFT_1452554 [Lyophyllum atratum]
MHEVAQPHAHSQKENLYITEERNPEGTLRISRILTAPSVLDTRKQNKKMEENTEHCMEGATIAATLVPVNLMRDGWSGICVDAHMGAYGVEYFSMPLRERAQARSDLRTRMGLQLLSLVLQLIVTLRDADGGPRDCLQGSLLVLDAFTGSDTVGTFEWRSNHREPDSNVLYKLATRHISKALSKVLPDDHQTVPEILIGNYNNVPRRQPGTTILLENRIERRMCHGEQRRT